MPRALTIQRTLVTPPEREKFQEKLLRKREHYSRSNCKFWVFEEASLPGAFLEFFEAADPATLAKAHAASPDPVMDPARVYTEVELP
jgi:hypothetical protein